MVAFCSNGLTNQSTILLFGCASLPDCANPNEETKNKNSNKENFVEVSIAYEFEGRIFVVISELNSGQGKDYIFEFNNDGKIIDWCKSSEYTQMIFGL